MSLQIGDIVCYNTHAYFENLTDIVITGDPQLLSPIMIVVEKCFHKNINAENKSQVLKECKCIWYSSKSQQFEETWLQPLLLKRIERRENVLRTKLSLGDQVVLISHEYELNKMKSNISYDEIANGISNKKVNSNSLLSFVSPVMSVIQIKKNDKVIKNANLEICEEIIKCKWYNAKADKFSEYFLPFEAIKLLKVVDLNLLNKAHDLINSGSFLRIKSKKTKTILNPSSIVYRSGVYMIKGFDYLLNRINDFEIDQFLKFDVLKKPFTKRAPIFNLSKTLKPMNNIEKIVIIGSKKKAYLRIEYKNKNDKFTVRTLKKYKVEQNSENGRKVLYLTGFCLTKEDIRSFRFDRIQQIEILDIKFK